MNITQEGDEYTKHLVKIATSMTGSATYTPEFQAFLNRDLKSKVEDEMQDIIDERNKEPYQFTVHSSDVNEPWAQEKLKSKKI